MRFDNNSVERLGPVLFLAFKAAKQWIIKCSKTAKNHLIINHVGLHVCWDLEIHYQTISYLIWQMYFAHAAQLALPQSFFAFFARPLDHNARACNIHNCQFIVGLTHRFSYSTLSRDPHCLTIFMLKFHEIQPLPKDIESNLGVAHEQERKRRREAGKLALMGGWVRWIRNRVCVAHMGGQKIIPNYEAENKLLCKSNNRNILINLNWLNN